MKATPILLSRAAAGFPFGASALHAATEMTTAQPTEARAAHKMNAVRKRSEHFNELLPAAGSLVNGKIQRSA
jgi:hypothetical protein